MIQGFGPLFEDIQKIARGQISTLYLFWKIRISMYLLKRVADDMSGFKPRKQVKIIIQSLTSTIALITVYWMPKARHVALFPYLALQ